MFPAQEEDERFKRISVCEKIYIYIYYWFDVGLIVVVGFSNTTHKI